MTHKRLDQYVVDVDVVSSLRVYLWYGLDPGSFGQAILLGDKERAYRCAHSLLKSHVDKPIEQMFELIWDNPDTKLPRVCLGRENVQRWIDHKGMDGADPASAVEVKMLQTDQWWA